MAEQWFPTRRRFDDALDALSESCTRHEYDMALIARLEAELDEYRKLDGRDTSRSLLRPRRRVPD